MKFNDFKDLKYLNPNTVTAWGESAFDKYQGLDRLLVKKTDLFIDYMMANGAGTYKIHDFNTRTHDGKDHPNGLAVDLDFTGIPLGDQVIFALMFNWTKVGFYPSWNNPGLHLSLVLMTPPLIWYGIQQKEGVKFVQKYVYSSRYPIEVTREIIRNAGHY